MLRGDDDVEGVVVCFGGVTLPPFVPSLDEGRRGVVFWLIMSVNLRVKDDFFGSVVLTVMAKVSSVDGRKMQCYCRWQQR